MGMKTKNIGEHGSVVLLVFISHEGRVYGRDYRRAPEEYIVVCFLQFCGGRLELKVLR